MKKVISVFSCSFLISAMLFLSSNIYSNVALSQQAISSQGQDSVTALLDGKVIPVKGFIHLYDSTPSIIKNGDVAAHVPCDSKGEASVKIVAGVAPNVQPINMTLVDQLSRKGTMCIYHVDLPPQSSTAITDVALLNPTGENITLPPTSSVVIHVSEFGLGKEMH